MVFRGLLTAITALAVLLSATEASAQEEPEGFLPRGITPYTTTTTSGATTTIGAVVLGVYLVTRPRRRVMLQYMRDNAVALRGDISRGAGPTLDDLAQLFGIPPEQLPAFGRLARQHRSTWLQFLTPGEIDGEDADHFVQGVREALRRS